MIDGNTSVKCSLALIRHSEDMFTLYQWQSFTNGHVIHDMIVIVTDNIAPHM